MGRTINCTESDLRKYLSKCKDLMNNKAGLAWSPVWIGPAIAGFVLAVPFSLLLNGVDTLYYKHEDKKVKKQEESLKVGKHATLFQSNPTPEYNDFSYARRFGMDL